MPTIGKDKDEAKGTLVHWRNDANGHIWCYLVKSDMCPACDPEIPLQSKYSSEAFALVLHETCKKVLSSSCL